jgi:hypothetical protein
MKNRLLIVTSGLALVLGITSVSLFVENRRLSALCSAYEKNVNNDSLKERDAVVVQKVSGQMEKYAYEQRDIANWQYSQAVEQRSQAVEQKKFADIERMKAEEEKVKAQAAQHEAVVANQKTEEQRQLAIRGQQMAIAEKLKADTLAQIALASNLGTRSLLQHQSGNDELASLLAYASWSFASQNKGNVYDQAVYKSLQNSCAYSHNYALHNGAIRSLFWNTATHHLFSVSSSGDIAEWKMLDGKLSGAFIYSNPALDLRDVTAFKDNICAIDIKGSLVVIDQAGQTRIIKLPDAKYEYLENYGDKLTAYTKDNRKIDVDIHLQYPNTTLVQCEDLQRTHDIILNGDKYHMTSSQDGTIQMSKEGTGGFRTLVGHRSPVTNMMVHDNTLYTSSLDGTILLWHIDSKTSTPFVLTDFGSWIHDFTFDDSGSTMYVALENGQLQSIMVNPNQMASMIHDNLKRDFTTDEWNFYVGAIAPYKHFMKTSR